MPPSPTCDIAPLRSPRRPSGYRGVYYHRTNRDGVPVWVGKVKAGRRLVTLPGSRSTDPRVSAAAVAAYHAGRFGRDWPMVLQKRCHNPWKVWRSRKYGGYLACVWLWGEPSQVRRVGRRGPAGDPLVFATAADARRGVRRYVRQVWGLFAELATWRS